MTGRAWHAGHRRTRRQGSGGLRRSKGSGSVSSSGPANHAAYAEIRNLAAPGNQSMTCAERESTKACLSSSAHNALPPRPNSFITRHNQLGNEGMAEDAPGFGSVAAGPADQEAELES